MDPKQGKTMEKVEWFGSFFASALLMAATLWGGEGFQRNEQQLGDNWRFKLESGERSFPTAPDYNDTAWRVLSLPHDWAFENGYSRRGPQGANGGYASGGIGWYRRALNFTREELKGRRLFLNFDAVYMNSEVWINGHLLGKRPYGYVSFHYEITPFVRSGRNMISVRVDNSLEPSARWYHGCGIYGGVTLVSTASSCLVKDGTFAATTYCDKDRAELALSAECDPGPGKTGKDLAGTFTILSPEGKKLFESAKLKPDQRGVLSCKTTLDRPALWDLESPVLYTLETALYENGTLVDKTATRFGTRSVKWDSHTGFYLNGRHVELRGSCEHLEGGPVGAAWTPNMIRWKLKLFKDMGCNAIRTAHNPQVPLFYDLCDEMGIMVMDEFFDGWVPKAPHDYGKHAFKEWWERDVRALVRRDRNHPSIIIYSAGNETHGPAGAKIVKVCHEIDPTRLVTSGQSASGAMDVHGVNGVSELKHFIDTHQVKEKTFVGTENPHTWQVRGYYRSKTWYRDGFRWDFFKIPDLTEKEIFNYEWAPVSEWANRKQHFNSSYDNATVRSNVRQIIEVMRTKPWFSGCFRWTGFDYPGEAGFVHGGWPFRAFMGGALDLAGFPKDLFYLYQSQWTDKPMIHLLPSWTHPYMPLGTKIPVFAYTTGDEAELFLDGKSLGRKKCGPKWDEMSPLWMVPWKPGTLLAIGYKGGKEIAREQIATSGAPGKLVLVKEDSSLTGRADDLHIITVKSCDAKGELYPYGENRVYFHPVNCEIFSAESGNPVDCETNWRARSRAPFFGLLRLFVRSAGENPFLYTGSILGDKRLKLSSKIALDVHATTLEGKEMESGCRLLYTTDGSDPLKNGKPYTAPFELKRGGLVRAVALKEGKPLLTMEESFGPNEGIYWDLTGEKVEIAGIQAESCTLLGGIIEQKAKGFQSKGYVSLPKTGTALSFYQENDGAQKRVPLTFGYLLKRWGTATLEIAKKGGKSETLLLSGYGMQVGKWQTAKVMVDLNPGANTFTVRLKAGNEVAIDWFDIQ